MSQIRAGTRRRLQNAALTLYAEQGFANTTVAAVAARAGLTERTYFRYFPDKQEVLFADDDVLLTVLLEEVRSAPAVATEGELATMALGAIARELEPRREVLQLRSQVLAANLDLFSRDVTKHAQMVRALQEEIEARGASHASAALTAAVAGAIFRVAYGTWLADHDSLNLTARLNEAINQMPRLKPIS